MALELNGTTGVSLVQDGVVTAADLASGAITSAALPAGSVLQVVQGSELSSETSITSGSYTDTGISVSMTPSSTSSKVLLFVTFHINNRRSSGSGTMNARVQIADGSNNNVYEPSFQAELIYYFASPASGDLDFWRTNTITYLDSPSTDSSITYKLRAGADGGDYVRFRGGHITAMEIAG